MKKLEMPEMWLFHEKAGKVAHPADQK